jgi:hypothetical protein
LPCFFDNSWAFFLIHSFKQVHHESIFHHHKRVSAKPGLTLIFWGHISISLVSSCWYIGMRI